MRGFTQTPWFYVTCILISTGIHGLLLSHGFFGQDLSDGLFHHFMEAGPGRMERPFAAGPLIFSFYELFSSLSQNPASGMLAGTLVLIAMITYVILKVLSRLGAPSWLLLSAGLWAVVSPSMHLLSIHHPEILLGLIFLLLLFLSATSKNYLLVVVFLVHLFLTHYILAGF